MLWEHRDTKTFLDNEENQATLIAQAANGARQSRMHFALIYMCRIERGAEGLAISLYRTKFVVLLFWFLFLTCLFLLMPVFAMISWKDTLANRVLILLGFELALLMAAILALLVRTAWKNEERYYGQLLDSLGITRK